MTLDFDATTRIVTGPLGSVRLPPAQASMFRLLAMRHSGGATHAAIETVLWGRDRYDRDPNAVKVNIARLRKLLSTIATGHLIVSDWGRGYRLTVPVTVTLGLDIAVLRPEDLREATLWIEQRGGPGAERILDLLHAAR